MGCRCSDISKLKGDISKLKRALTYAGNAENSKSDTIQELSNAAAAYEGGVVFDGTEINTAENLRTSYTKASGAISSAKTAISKAISSAQRRLSSLESEDESYHSQDDDD